MSKRLKCTKVLLPGEEALDRIKLGGIGSDAEVVLTDQRILVSGPTDVLGSHLTLGPGSMVSGFPLTEYTGFVISSSRQPLFFLAFLALASSGGVLLAWDLTRIPGLILIAASIIIFLIWTVWRRTSLEILARGLRFSGHVNPGEAIVFVERLQLAAHAAKAGGDPPRVREHVRLSAKPRAQCEIVDDDDSQASIMDDTGAGG